MRAILWPIFKRNVNEAIFQDLSPFEKFFDIKFGLKMLTILILIPYFI